MKKFRAKLTSSDARNSHQVTRISCITLCA
nr:MAG TPA: hypothetical protein [Caudoviricetes sp.]